MMASGLPTAAEAAELIDKVDHLEEERKHTVAELGPWLQETTFTKDATCSCLHATETAPASIQPPPRNSHDGSHQERSNCRNPDTQGRQPASTYRGTESKRQGAIDKLEPGAAADGRISRRLEKGDSPRDCGRQERARAPSTGIIREHGDGALFDVYHGHRKPGATRSNRTRQETACGNHTRMEHTPSRRI